MTAGHPPPEPPRFSLTTSFQWAPVGYFADATAAVDDEQCTIGIQATIENAANYKLIAGTWTISESEDDDGELDD